MPLPSDKALPPQCPGDVLLQMIRDLPIDQMQDRLGLSPLEIVKIVEGTAKITPEVADLLGKSFGQSPTFWIDLQSRWDAWEKVTGEGT